MMRFINKLLYTFEKSNTYKKAKKEFEILKEIWIREGNKDPDMMPLVLEFEKEILKLVDKFGKSGQSGGSAPYTASAISNTVKHLCMHETLSALTGGEDEWNLVDFGGSDIVGQNKRNSAVFKNKDGSCSYSNAIIFQGEDEYDTFTGFVEEVTSSLKIKKFPFTPKRFYIDVTRELNTADPNRVSCANGDYLYKIKDRSQLEAVKEPYIL